MKKLFIIPVIISALVIFSFPAQLFAGNADDFAEAMHEDTNATDFIEGNLDGTDASRSAAIYDWIDLDSRFSIIQGTEGWNYIGLSTGDIYNNNIKGNFYFDQWFIAQGTPDYTTFTFGTFEVPAGVSEFYFDFYYITAENGLAGYVDPFTAKVYGSSVIPDGASVVSGVIPGEIGANDSYRDQEIEAVLGWCGLYNGSTGISWTTATCPVSPGDIVYIEFTITDSIDGQMDSVVFLDNFRFGEPIATISGLAEVITSLELPDGIETELTSVLNAAINQLEKGNDKTALNQLNAFINKVEAQRGKKITDEQADILIGLAQSLIEGIEQ
jgi:hypothetical protein